MVSVPAAVTQIAADGRLTRRQQRRLILDLALRRQRPGTGSSEAFNMRRTALNPWPDLRGILSDLRWAIVGDVATRAYMPERTTLDLNIIVHPEDGPQIWQRLRAARFAFISNLAMPGQTWTTPDGVEIDVLEGQYQWIDEALDTPVPDAAGYPVIGLPYLVMLKMTASRAIDLGDLTRLLGLASELQLEDVRQAVARHMPEDSDDLETLILLGKQEMQFPPA